MAHSPVPWTNAGTHLQAGRGVEVNAGFTVADFKTFSGSCTIRDDEIRENCAFAAQACNTYDEILTHVMAAAALLHQYSVTALDVDLALTELLIALDLGNSRPTWKHKGALLPGQPFVRYTGQTDGATCDDGGVQARE